MRKKVLDVGQCDIDNWQIKNLLENHFDVEVIRANTHADAMAALEDDTFALILINRINDADGSEGVELIRSLKQSEVADQTAVMMVSNFEVAQAKAVEAGAMPGFGKNDLHSPATIERLARCLND